MRCFARHCGKRNRGPWSRPNVSPSCVALMRALGGTAWAARPPPALLLRENLDLPTKGSTRRLRRCVQRSEVSRGRCQDPKTNRERQREGMSCRGVLCALALQRSAICEHYKQGDAGRACFFIPPSRRRGRGAKPGSSFAATAETLPQGQELIDFRAQPRG